MLDLFIKELIKKLIKKIKILIKDILKFKIIKEIKEIRIFKTSKFIFISLFQRLKIAYIATKVQNKQKVFCIGLNKTGTTSMKAAFEELGFIVAPQLPAEKLFFDWVKRDFKRIIAYCKTSGEAFQDIPFSLPFTYVILDHYFPNSKFILTIRNNPEQWYKSITRYHGKLWSQNNKIPTKNDLIKAKYIVEGYPYYALKHIFNTPDKDLYNKNMLINFYSKHIENVEEYFHGRANDLLILNVAKKNAYQKLAKFLGSKTNKTKFPWKNKTIILK
jgi:hypothetical protein